MKRNTHNSTISINQNTPEVSHNSHKDAVTSTESHPSHDVESTSTKHSTYGSFYWLISYFRTFISRLANDLYRSLVNYWFPSRVMLPAHILHLMLVQDKLRSERESHTVTYSRYKLIHQSCLKSANERSTQTISLVSESDPEPPRRYQ